MKHQGMCSSDMMIYYTWLKTHTELGAATSYALPQNVFNDGALHCCVLELRVDYEHRHAHKSAGGVQWTFEPHLVHIVGVWINYNCGNENGSDFWQFWKPEQEVIPVGITEAGIFAGWQ